MKVKHVIVASALLTGVVILAIYSPGGKQRADAENAAAAPVAADAAKRNERRDLKPSASQPKANIVTAKDDVEAFATPSPDDEWMAQLSDRERSIAERLSAAIDNEDLAAIKTLAKEANGAQDDELRSRMVDALAWFDDKVLVELTQFLGDRNPEIAKAAFNAWDSAVEMVDDEKFRVEAATMAMQTLTDEDSVRLAAAKLESAEDSKSALKAAVDIAANEDNAAAAAAAREVYEFITGEEWPGTALARVKAITFNDEVDDTQEETEQ